MGTARRRFKLVFQGAGTLAHKDFQLAQSGRQLRLQRRNLGCRGLGLGARPHQIMAGANPFLEQPLGQFQRVPLRLQVPVRDAQLVLKTAIFDVGAREVRGQRHQ